MSEIIERVAMVHWKARRIPGLATLDLAEWSDLSAETKKNEIAATRLAIEAMLKPTEEMLTAGFNVKAYDGIEELDSYGPPGDVWKAMINTVITP